MSSYSENEFTQQVCPQIHAERTKIDFKSIHRATDLPQIDAPIWSPKWRRGVVRYGRCTSAPSRRSSALGHAAARSLGGARPSSEELGPPRHRRGGARHRRGREEGARRARPLVLLGTVAEELGPPRRSSALLGTVAEELGPPRRSSARTRAFCRR